MIDTRAIIFTKILPLKSRLQPAFCNVIHPDDPKETNIQTYIYTGQTERTKNMYLVTHNSTAQKNYYLQVVLF